MAEKQSAQREQSERNYQQKEAERLWQSSCDKRAFVSPLHLAQKSELCAP
jgi:hypothetical protein